MIYCFYKHDHLKFQGLIVMHKESNCLNKYFLIFSFCHLILAEGKYRNLLGTEWKTGLHWDVHELAKNFTRESWSLPSVVRNSTRHVTNLKTPSKWDRCVVRGMRHLPPSPVEPVTVQTSLIVCKLFTGSWLRTKTISFEDFIGRYYCEKQFEGYQVLQHPVLAQDAHMVQRHPV